MADFACVVMKGEPARFAGQCDGLAARNRREFDDRKSVPDLEAQPCDRLAGDGLACQQPFDVCPPELLIPSAVSDLGEADHTALVHDGKRIAGGKLLGNL